MTASAKPVTAVGPNCKDGDCMRLGIIYLISCEACADEYNEKTGFWCKDIQPSKSPYFNPSDNPVWPVLEEVVSATAYTGVDALKTTLTPVWNEIWEGVSSLLEEVDVPKAYAVCGGIGPA
ncbi:hypothetical protein KIN20_008399 [Parelaphostrongylus tenuis]|uniref:Uncharacterized protein n=1 Tax=Parelaphostrongylus tenuis TaxID=148309 RepID=A0AAD5QIW8_PARTN|nr:hypothetical protein KIN20_008399 [Parelaphostrongylus tenuis]